MLLVLIGFWFLIRLDRGAKRAERIVNVSFWLMAELLILSWVGTVVFTLSLKECSFLTTSLQWWGGVTILASIGQWGLYFTDKLYQNLFRPKR